MTELQRLHDTDCTLLMGVLNITEDSFSDGGLWLDPGKARDHGDDMLHAGADIIDIGAESSRPGFKTMPAQQEIERLMPFLEAVLRRRALALPHVTVVRGRATGLDIVGAAVAGVLLSMIFALLTQYLLSNQVATGLALTMFGLGLTAMFGKPYEGVKAPAMMAGPLGLNLMIWLGLVMVPVVWWGLMRTRAGLVLRAVGENHDAAHALGYPVRRVRLAAIAFGGAMAGMGGAYISIATVLQWTEGMTAGAGWIALAIVVFAQWNPWGVLAGAWLSRLSTNWPLSSLRKPSAPSLNAATHSLHEPGYRRLPFRPAYSIDSRLWQAVTPEPHWATTLWASPPLMSLPNSSCSRAACLKQPLASRLSWKKRLMAPGMCPPTGSSVSFSPRKRSGARASMISTSGSFSAWLAAVFTRVTMSAPKPLGPYRPNQVFDS